jgi:hypothetical protein
VATPLGFWVSPTLKARDYNVLMFPQTSRSPVARRVFDDCANQKPDHQGGCPIAG